MSAYKKLNKQDAFITTYVAHKQWAITGSQFSLYNINFNPGVVGTKLNSLQQLYYPTKVSGSVPSNIFDYYPQTTLYQSQSRELTTGSFLLSIPRELYGTAMKPEDGFSLRFPQNLYEIFLPVVDGYITEDYLVPYPITVIGMPRPIRKPISRVILDDGEGQLYVSGSSPREYVGDIIYTHGMLVITDPTYASIVSTAITDNFTRGSVVLNFKSSQPIFTHNYHCKVRESEFNFTYNPSALSSSLKTVYDNNDTIYSTSSNVSTGELSNNITGSAFQPYITTVGLYNDANQLIAVGKVNRPVPKSANTEMTIIVKIDI